MLEELLAVERHDGKMTSTHRNLLESHLKEIMPWEEQDDEGDDYVVPWTFDDQSVALEELPSEAVYIAEFQNETERPETTWKSDITFYACKIKSDPKITCLLKLNWDDNWSCWEWSCVASLEFHTEEKNFKYKLMKAYATVALKTAGGGDWEDFLQSWA